MAATAVAMETLKPAGKKETMTHRSVRTEVLIFLGWESGPSYNSFGYVSTKEPVAQLVARIIVLLLSLKTFEQR